MYSSQIQEMICALSYAWPRQSPIWIPSFSSSLKISAEISSALLPFVSMKRRNDSSTFTSFSGIDSPFDYQHWSSRISLRPQNIPLQKKLPSTLVVLKFCWTYVTLIKLCIVIVTMLPLSKKQEFIFHFFSKICWVVCCTIILHKICTFYLCCAIRSEEQTWLDGFDKVPWCTWLSKVAH